jgi:hypothetical protein
MLSLACFEPLIVAFHSGRVGGLAIKAATVIADIAMPARADFLGRAGDRAATTQPEFRKLKITGENGLVMIWTYSQTRLQRTRLLMNTWL